MGILAPRRRPIVFGLLVAAVATAVVLAVAVLARPGGGDPGTIARNRPAPAIVGTTLEGEAFDLAALRGRPVIVNFWGPTCVPCRDEFPLLKAKLAEHAADEPAVVGILMADPPDLARAFVAEQAATWPTVIDPDGAIKAAYRVALRPQTYFVDREGVLRSIQIGELLEPDFERQYALIAGGS
jgi:cytochrome c biogenesis protein CcmG/thiol:disulfide interchange protein DsbE